MVAAAGLFAGALGIGAAGATATAWGAAWVAGAGFASTMLGSVAVRLLTSVAVSALSRALQKRSKTSAASGGIRTSDTLTGETNPETLILGWTATAGQAVCPQMSHGDQHRYLTHVIELCSAPGATLDRVIINNDYVTLGAENSEYGRPVVGGTYDGLIWVRYYNGTQTAADPMLLAKYGAYPDRPWTTDMVGNGICYAILTFLYHQERLTSVPKYRFEMTGIPLYDPRLDSSVGGTGAQRWSDPSTWAQTVNNAVICYNIKRGITLPGGDVWGGQIESADLPMANWVAAMNACDQWPTGGNAAQYRGGLEVFVSDPPADAIEEFLKGCSGDVADIAGRWKIRVGGPGVPVMTITDADIIRTREESLDPFPSLDSTYNGITATAPDPDALWESRELPARYNAAWEAADRFGRKTASIQLNAVPYPEQGQRLMRAWIEAERRFRTHKLALSAAAAALEPLDTIAWTSTRNGYELKQMEITETIDDLMTCIQGEALREVDPADYDWSPTFELPTTPAAPGYTPPAAEAVLGWAVAAITLKDANGVSRRPAIGLSWNADLIADGIQWRIRVQGSAEVRTGSTQAVAAGGFVISEGILPGAPYEVQGRMILTGRETVWTAWTVVETENLLISAVDLDPTIEQSIAGAAQAAENVRIALEDSEDARAISEQAQSDAIANAVAMAESASTLVVSTAATDGVLSDQYNPNGSSYWTAGGTAASSVVEQVDNEVYALGQTWRFALAAADAKYMITTTARSIWTGQATALAYVIEVEFDLESGGCCDPR